MKQKCCSEADPCLRRSRERMKEERLVNGKNENVVRVSKRAKEE
jgi:hypothetical protein